MNSQTCCVSDCNNKRDGRSVMCSKHRRRKRLYGHHSITKNNKPGEGFIHLGYRGFQINGKKIFEHVMVAENVLGKKLPKNSVVHHVNGNKLDNRNENLVICQDRAYHNLIHARENALNACGDPNKRKCIVCNKYDYVNNMMVSGTRFKHKKGSNLCRQ